MPFYATLRHTARTHLRTFIAVAIGILAGLSFPRDWGWISRALLGWDTFVLVFLVSIVPLAAGWTPERLRDRASREDEGRVVILLLLLVGAIASFFAIGLAIRPTQGMRGWTMLRYAMETGGTIVLSWALMQTLFALHYARDWYVHERRSRTKNDPGLLDFPGDELPGFSDFLYFAFTVGMTFQTSDVAVRGRAMRRLVVLHAAVAFFFNTGIVALSINIVAGLLH
jgi:uncharacterized membrane protein